MWDSPVKAGASTRGCPDPAQGGDSAPLWKLAAGFSVLSGHGQERQSTPALKLGIPQPRGTPKKGRAQPQAVGGKGSLPRIRVRWVGGGPHRPPHSLRLLVSPATRVQPHLPSPPASLPTPSLPSAHRSRALAGAAREPVPPWTHSAWPGVPEARPAQRTDGSSPQSGR